MQDLGHIERQSLAYPRRTQECDLCHELQCSLRVTILQSRDKIVTGCFDTTAKLWETETGKLLHTFAGHQNEVVAVAFDPHKSLVATGSMDHTAKLWDLETGK